MEGSQEYLLELDRRENDLRDRFAMAALSGIMADPNVNLETQKSYEVIAQQSYGLADAMLKARGNPVGAVGNTQNTMGSSEKTK